MSNIGQGINTTQNALRITAELVLAGRRGRVFCEVKNADSSINVYLGGTDAVTSSTGHLLRPGEAVGFAYFVGPIYAIAASGTPTVTTIEW